MPFDGSRTWQQPPWIWYVATARTGSCRIIATLKLFGTYF
jgi:hypothetical protein